jgi:hypothetical protein
MKLNSTGIFLQYLEYKAFCRQHARKTLSFSAYVQMLGEEPEEDPDDE